MSKVLFYINTLGRGGAERVMVNLANNLSECGFDVILVTSFPTDSEYQHNPKVKRISLYSKRESSFYERNVGLVYNLRRLIKTEKPDTVVSFMAEPNFRMLISTLGMKCRKIISVRNDPNREYPNGLFKFLAKTLYNFADGIVFQTEDARSWFPEGIQRKSCIIMNQVDDIFFNTPLSQDRKNIVSTGRLTEQKNHKMLIHAFGQIAEDVNENLIIYGEGELRHELEELVRRLGLENRVFLPGATKNVPEVLSKAKIFVLSSDYEGMPNSLLEAMAMGLPCISTDCPCGGPRDVLSSVDNRLLVEVGNEVEMSAEIKRLCNLSDEESEQLSCVIKQQSEKYKSEIVFEQWGKYINNV